MSVEVSPRDYLGFRRPFNNPVTSHLKLRNPHHKPIVVKIKVTSPKAYCVRPNSSRIEPGESLEIAVILQPMKEQPPAYAKCKDKFLVCSAEIPVEKESMALTDYWYELEKTDKSKIQEHKLRVAYISDAETIPEDSVGDVSRYNAEDTTNGGFASPSTSRMMSAEASTPTGTPRSNGNIQSSLPYPATPIHVTNVQTQHAPAIPTSTGPAPAPASTFDPAQVARSVAGPGPGPGALSTPSKSSNLVPKAEFKSLSTSNEAAQGGASTLVQTAEEQLAHARAQISQLQTQLASSDLGQRVKGAVGDVQAKAAQVVPHQIAENVEGYQLTVVLAVAVAAFSIGYLWHSWA